MPTAPDTPVQREGPFLTPAGPARRNVRLLALLLPVVILLLIGRGRLGEANLAHSLTLLATLAGALAALPAAPAPRRALQDLDWAVGGALAWLLAAFAGLFPPGDAPILSGPVWGFLCGLVSGLLVTRTRHYALLAAPALPAFLATGLILGLLWAVLILFFPGTVPPSTDTGNGSGFPATLALLAAGLAQATGRRARFWLLLPWLAGGLATWAAFDPQAGIRWAACPLLSFPYERLPGLLAVALLVAPPLAATPGGLVWREAVTLVFLFFGPPSSAGPDPAPWLAVLVITAPDFLPRPRKKNTAASNPSWPVTPARPRLQCGHHGQAPRLAEWAGLASCRLASAHDGGFLLCPYGCLGLGDCVRACPHGALRLADNGFPTIDGSRCQGCGRCQAACPKSLFESTDGTVRAFIPCASPAPLKKNADYCPQGCLGCGRCRKACPAGAIGRAGAFGAMRVDQAVCRAYGPSCGRACARACPRRLFGS